MSLSFSQLFHNYKIPKQDRNTFSSGNTKYLSVHWLSSRNFFQGGQSLLLRKFLLLCYCFRTKFQGGAKVFRGANCLRGGAPLPPVEESQVHRPDLQSRPNVLSSEKSFVILLFDISLLKYHAILRGANSQTPRMTNEMIRKRRIVLNAFQRIKMKNKLKCS